MGNVALKLSMFLVILYCYTRTEASQHTSTYKSHLGLFKRLDECYGKGGLAGVVNCAASRTLKMLSKTAQEKTLQLSTHVQLIADNGVSSRTSKSLISLNEAELPQDPVEQARKLFSLLLDTAGNLISGRTLKVKFPHMNSVQYGRAFEEGRAKIKKLMGPLMLGLGSNLMTVVMPILMTGLAVLSTKALVVGKLALAVSVVLVLQYILSHRTPDVPPSYFPYSGFNLLNSGGYSGTYGSNIPSWSNSQYPYARSLDVSEKDINEDNTEQQLAYSGHR